MTAIDLAMDAGELVGVAGRNGAGKSTLALGVTGYVPRLIRAETEGTVRVLGQEPGPRAAGLVLADPGAQLSASKTTVREELAFGLENIGLPREQMGRRIDEALQDLGIPHLADRHPFSLSGGEQQRVAIASILVMGTSLLVLDEPTAQLDPVATTGVAEVLRQQASAGMAILVAEHDPAVLAGTQRCLVLHDGRVAVDDVPGRALAPRPETDFLALEAPRLAASLGIESAQSFDEDALTAALASRIPQSAAPVPFRSDDGNGASPWSGRRAQAPASVDVVGLVHRYPNGVDAVRGVDLHIGAGDSVAIVGQNGSGKTTLVKHLNGLLRPTAGTVSICGRATAAEPVHELARLVGYVFQDPGDQLFNRTVAREVRFGPRNLRLPEADVDALVAAALDAVGLDAERETNPYDLDMSARKLVALASVLSMDPAVLVLDEPTTGQDGPGVAAVGRVVESFSAGGRAVIAVTHDMGFAARHFARVVVMRHGEIVLDGSPHDVFAPAHWDVLASTGVTPPLAVRLSARAGRPIALTVAALLAPGTGH